MNKILSPLDYLGRSSSHYEENGFYINQSIMYPFIIYAYEQSTNHYIKGDKDWRILSKDLYNDFFNKYIFKDYFSSIEEHDCSKPIKGEWDNELRCTAKKKSIEKIDDKSCENIIKIIKNNEIIENDLIKIKNWMNDHNLIIKCNKGYLITSDLINFNEDEKNYSFDLRKIIEEEISKIINY